MASLSVNDYTHTELLGKCPQMQSVRELIEQAAEVDIPVLIVGDTGTGKDLVASAIHQRSPRKDRPFVAVNMGASTPELVGSELFGHVEGAFTGATSDKRGSFEEADGGVIFLDEIGTMDERVQINLLHVLEAKTIRPIGSEESIEIDVRIIAATNQNLRQAVADGSFREDLLFRFEVFRIKLPRLSERGDDIELLAEAFVKEFNKEFQRDIQGFTIEAMELLGAYHWQGNVRELKNVVQQAVVLSSGDWIRPGFLPNRIRSQRPPLPSASLESRAQPGQTEESSGQQMAPTTRATPAESATIRATDTLTPDPSTPNDLLSSLTSDVICFNVGVSLADAERTIISHTLKHADGNKTKAAQILGINRKTLYNRIRKLGIET